MPRNKSATASSTTRESPTSPEQLDFSSAEFNHINDLDNNTGNFRAFYSLTAIVTADMRRQEQWRQLPSRVQEPAAERG